MKKTTISFSFDDEKINAIKLYLGKGDTTLEDELVKAMDSIYSKNVPAPVREFIDLRAGVEAPEQISKPRRMRARSSVNDTVTEAEEDAIE